MPVTRAVDVGNGAPPVGAAYHRIFVPVAVREPTVGLFIAQNAWVEDPVGAAGSATVTATASRVSLSQPATVWLAK